MAHHHVDPAAITAALIFMALAMLLTRVVTMGIRARNLTPAAGKPATQTGAEHTPAPDTAGTRWTNLARQVAEAASDAASSRTQNRRPERTARREARRSWRPR
jgi:hypothetical protein